MRPAKGQRIAFSCGGAKGGNAPIWHTTLLAKCSVLYLLSGRKTGSFLQMGMSRKQGGFRSGSRDIGAF